MHITWYHNAKILSDILEKNSDCEGMKRTALGNDNYETSLAKEGTTSGSDHESATQCINDVKLEILREDY